MFCFVLLIFRKAEKGKLTHRICEINKRHKSAVEAEHRMCLVKTGDKKWNIESLTKKGTYYILQQLQETCSCKLNCSVCHACVHMYLCTCMDATIHNTVCKHVHLLHMSVNVDRD